MAIEIRPIPSGVTQGRSELVRTSKFNGVTYTEHPATLAKALRRDFTAAPIVRFTTPLEGGEDHIAEYTGILGYAVAEALFNNGERALNPSAQSMLRRAFGRETNEGTQIGVTFKSEKLCISEATIVEIETRDRVDGQPAEAHKIQRRKFADQPYLVHPLRVALLSIDLAQAMGEKVTTELVLGALMHDTIEDSPRFGENGKGGAVFKKETVKSLFATWSLFGVKAEAIAADADAFDHNTALEDGKVNDAKYYDKLKHWLRKVFVRRQIIKAADRIDNLLDPLTISEGLSAAELMRANFLDDMDKIANQDIPPQGLNNPPEGSLAEKLRQKRINYIEETNKPQGIIKRLLPEGSFLRRAIQKTIDISQQTIYEPSFTPDGLLLQLKNEML